MGKGTHQASEARYCRAADSSRPYRSHRYEVWSPKISRRLTLFGIRSLHCWIRIEADSGIKHFCERPVVIPSDKGNIVADFWVDHGGSEAIWLVRSSAKFAALPVLDPSFVSWASEEGISIRYVTLEDDLSDDMRTRNWMSMLHYLAANSVFVSRDIENEIAKLTRMPVSIEYIQSQMPSVDPVVVRTGVFSLIEKGVLKCDDFGSKPWSPHTKVQQA